MEDILLDDDFDLKIENGDIAIGSSLKQHDALLLLCNTGELRRTPYLGVGLISYLNDDELVGLRDKIQKNIELDGRRVVQLQAAWQ